MLNRRSFLKSSIGSVGAMPWLGSGLLSGLNKSNSNHVMVVIQVGGGWDMLSQWIPYGVPEYAQRRGVAAYAAPGDTSVPVQRRALPGDPSIGAGFAPGFTEIKNLYDRGDVAVVQKVGYPTPSRSHFTSLQIWRFGERDLSPVSYTHLTLPTIYSV